MNEKADFAVEINQHAAALPSEDLFEAVTAFREKRAPVFKGK